MIDARPVHVWFSAIKERPMSVRQKILGARVLLGGVVLALPLLGSTATAGASDPHDAGNCASDFHGGPSPRPGPPNGRGFGPFGGDRDEGRLPPFLMGLDLTEEQQDKVFAIVHAAAPALRDQSKAEHKAREALRELVTSAKFSDGTASTLAQAQGKAESELSLLRTRMAHQVYSVLTPEQQARAAKRRQEFESHRGEGPPPRH
jgi:Spy/CpxP family protein refolding chaperone